MAGIRAKINRTDRMTVYDVDPKTTIELIERMKVAKVGEYDRWVKLAKKIKGRQALEEDEIDYLARFARTYRGPGVTSRSRILHVRLSEEDQKPKCLMCGEKSEFYCNQNDAYFCAAHIVGHDENER